MPNNNWKHNILRQENNSQNILSTSSYHDAKYYFVLTNDQLRVWDGRVFTPRSGLNTQGWIFRPRSFVLQCIIGTSWLWLHIPEQRRFLTNLLPPGVSEISKQKWITSAGRDDGAVVNPPKAVRFCPPPIQTQRPPMGENQKKTLGWYNIFTRNLPFLSKRAFLGKLGGEQLKIWCRIAIWLQLKASK